MLDSQSQQKINLDPLIVGIMDEDNSTRLGVMNILLNKGWNHRLIFVSQTYLAIKLGVTRETINRTIRWLREHNWIRTKKRYDDTSLYFINPDIIAHRERLKWKLPALRYVLCVSMLWQAVSQANVTSNILMNYLYKNQSINQSIIPSIFLKNQSSTSNYDQHLSKERIMNEERPIINQIKDQFRIPDEEMSFFKKHSDIVLQDAVLLYDEATKEKNINHPIGYFRRVVGTAQEKHERKAEKGTRAAHSSKASNPNGHSPAYEEPKTSRDQRITFVLTEIAKLEKQLIERRGWLKNAFGGEELIELAENTIARYKRELRELQSAPDDMQCEAPRYRQKDPKETEYSEGLEYEKHLDEISKDKTDPAGYKEFIRAYDYRRTARR